MRDTVLHIKKTILRIWNFYAEGFRNMTLGRVLWLIILLKLLIMFCVLKPIFFPGYLNETKVGSDKAEYVAGELIQRAKTDSLTIK